MFQLMQFVILLLVTASFVTLAILPVLAKFTGVALSEVSTISKDSSNNVIQAALLYQFVGVVGIFLLPALLFGYFTHPKPLQYLGLRKPGKPIQWWLVVLVILSAVPVLVAIQSLLSMVELSASFKEMQEKKQSQMSGLLAMPNVLQFIVTFITIAILPAVSEELFFRGVMFRMAAKGTKKTIFAIVLTGLVFALFHDNIYGFVSIFLAGVLLAYIYYLTGSLWLSILAHMIHNGLQVILIYIFSGNAAMEKILKEDTLPWYIPVIGLVIFTLSFYALWKNRTPLPENWTDDFDEDEKQAMIADNPQE